VALQDALSERGGVWFGWDGNYPTRRASAPAVLRDGNIEFATLPLDEQDLERYYRGFANSVLWPLFHEHLDAIDHQEQYPVGYASVNEYFARGAEPLIEPGDVVWVHDYHLIPLGAELRRLGVPARMGFFLHTPFPPFDLFRALPDHGKLLETFFAYDLVGFQTAIDARHFAEALRRGLGAVVNEANGTAELAGRRVRFGAFPIGIDVEGTARVARQNREMPAGRRLVSTLRGRRLIMGADRLDYTKGLVKRLQAFGRFLERYESEVEDELIYVQIAAPSREEVDRYQALARQLELEAGRINALNNSIHWAPLRIMTRSVPRETLLGYFSLARVGLVTPLRDGMNLVAKEYLAAQTPEDPGVLVLSSLAGAAEELANAAIIVNPYDTEGVAEGLREALAMPLGERRRRWEIGMESLRANTAVLWRDRFLAALVGRPPIVERAPTLPRPPQRRRARRVAEPTRTAEPPGGTTSAA